MKISFEQLPQLPSIDLLAKKLVEGFITGLHKSPYHGFSVEFAEHRLYNNGESTKNIDWKVFAKTERLYTKQYDEETNLRAYLLVDNSSSMYYPAPHNEKIKFAVIAAASIAHLLQQQRDAVGLITFSEKIDLFTEVKSTKSHLQHIFKQLQLILNQQQSGRGTSLSESIHVLAEKAHKRSLIIIFSDLITSKENIQAFFQSIQHLKHKKHEVLFFQINHQQSEIELGLEDRPYQIEDLESGKKIKLNPFDLKERFQEQAQAYFKEIEMKCQQYKINLNRVDVDDDFDKILASFLIKRNKMH